MGEMEKPSARLWGKFIKVQNSCNGCGLCAQNCPSGNIIMAGGRPKFAYKCQMCLKCIYKCPLKALTPGMAKFIIIKEGYNLNDLAAKAALYEKDKNTDFNKTVKGNLAQDFKDYLRK